MIRVRCRPGSMTSLFAAILLAAVFVPANAQVVSPSTSAAVASSPLATVGSAGAESEDGPDKPSRLGVMADFNRDGTSDMAQVVPPADGSGLSFLEVSLGQADGVYKPVASRSTLGRSPKDIVVGDFNNDGIPDLIVGDDNGELMLLIGDGTGNMVAVGDIAHLESVVSIAVADFNHDGIPDLAVSDWRASTVTVLLGSGKGVFRSGGSFPLRMPGTTPHISVADFNGDGIPDLAVVYDDDQGDTFDVMLGTGKGSFTFAPQLSLTRDPNSHCVT